MRSLPILLLFAIGCGGRTPVEPETESQGAARVFALARDFEAGQKTKQAMAAYRQIVAHFPDTPEPRDASRRISEAQRASILKVRARRLN